MAQKRSQITQPPTRSRLATSTTSSWRERESTSGSGQLFARKFLEAGFDGLVRCFKTDEAGVCCCPSLISPIPPAFLEARYKKPHQRIENDLQTNGTLLDAEWATFLKEHNFLVGLSCDGPKRLHDHYRVTKGGRPTHHKVMAMAAARACSGNTARAVQRSVHRQPRERQVPARRVSDPDPRTIRVCRGATDLVSSRKFFVT